MSRRLLLGFALLAILSLCSCGPREKSPRTSNQIFRDRLTVDTLYLTEDGREVILPGDPSGAVVFPNTRELAWAARCCNNPNCPGKGKAGRPFLFPWPDPFCFVNEDGTVGTRQPESEKDFELFEKYAEPVCPACLKTRNREAETEEQRVQYKSWCQLYVLPESAERLKQLEEENRRRIDELDRRRHRKITGD